MPISRPVNAVLILLGLSVLAVQALKLWERGIDLQYWLKGQR